MGVTLPKRCKDGFIVFHLYFDKKMFCPKQIDQNSPKETSRLSSQVHGACLSCNFFLFFVLVFYCLFSLALSSFIHRDSKTYDRADNVYVKYLLARVKFKQSFTLFCELCHKFALFGCHFLFCTFWKFMLHFCVFSSLFGSFGPFTMFCCELDWLFSTNFFG